MSYESVLDELEIRGLLDTCTNLTSLRTRLAQGPARAYCGIDPTADSLHVGHLLSLAVLRLWMRHGHEAIALIGGATGMIGDPSGKSHERNLLSPHVLDYNRAALATQVERLLGAGDGVPIIVDNRTWFEDMGVLEFLREIGKLMPVREMLERDSVKNRLDKGGLSLTEFAYQALQAHDFAYLRQTMDCELQVGGTDQYGNITAGTDMIRRRGLGRSWGLVWPLLTKEDGGKFGKTDTGTVWLTAERTTPFAFHQYWLHTDDAEVRSLLAKFTLRSTGEIDALMRRHDEDRGARLPQRVLADDVTGWVHGAQAVTDANAAAAALFAGTLDPHAVQQVAGAIPTVRITREELRGVAPERLAQRTGLCESVSEARRLIRAGGLYVDGERVRGSHSDVSARGTCIVLRRGARHHALVQVVDA